MPSYIIRLDDACPTMNHKNWERMEKLLDFYTVKPIVGIIPDNMDPMFAWEEDKNFWEKARLWQEKGWTIALHGLHHKYQYHPHGRGYFQKSHSTNTEFAGVPLEEQRKMLAGGVTLLHLHGIEPECFFAPAHTYDENTVRALTEIKSMKFISDGYAFLPYQKQGMIFLPSICDGPFRFPAGVYTFVLHPSFMGEREFLRLKLFFESNHERLSCAQTALKKVRRSQGCAGQILEYGIFAVRGLRRLIKHN